jgi:hypothetical protein
MEGTTHVPLHGPPLHYAHAAHYAFLGGPKNH